MTLATRDKGQTRESRVKQHAYMELDKREKKKELINVQCFNMEIKNSKIDGGKKKVKEDEEEEKKNE